MRSKRPGRSRGLLWVQPPGTEHAHCWLAAIFLFLYREAVERSWGAVAVFPTRTMEPRLGHAFTALEPAGLLRRVCLEDLLKRGAMRGASLGLRLLRLVVLDTADLPAAARELADDARAEPDPLPLLDLITDTE